MLYEYEPEKIQPFSRAERGYSRGFLSRSAGVSASPVRALERTHLPRSEGTVLEAPAHVLGVSTSEVV